MVENQTTQRIGELEARIAKPLSRQAEIDDLNGMAWELRIGQKEQAYLLCEKACALSRAGAFADQPYRLGLAAAKSIMAFINIDWGKPDVAITQCIEALALLEGLPPSAALVDAWITMCWIHIYLGNYPVSLDYSLKALELAQSLKNKHLEAWALDAVASTYGISADLTNSIPLHEEALKRFAEIGDVQGEARTLNNMACSLLDMGSFDQALAASMRSLELAREQSLVVEIMIFSGTLGEVFLGLGEFDQAEAYFKSGLSEARSKSNPLWQIFLLLGLGKLHLKKNSLEGAEHYLLEAMRLTGEHDMRNEQADCHQLLSEMYERRQDLPLALEHYKQFHILKEATTGQETAKRLAILKVAHQSESAKRDAEIYRLRNIELQREIEERKRMEVLLQNMAIHDPLTNLFNRRQFYSLTKVEIERAKRYHQSLSVLMLDLDHFKQVNDHYGHLAGDQVLVGVAAIIRNTLREVDIIGRYGGEEFAVMLPETPGTRAREVGERICRSIREYPFETTAGSISVTVSIGATDFQYSREMPGNNLDTLLNRADQALYYAKRTGRNRVHLLTDAELLTADKELLT